MKCVFYEGPTREVLRLSSEVATYLGLERRMLPEQRAPHDNTSTRTRASLANQFAPPSMEGATIGLPEAESLQLFIEPSARPETRWYVAVGRDDIICRRNGIQIRRLRVADVVAESGDPEPRRALTLRDGSRVELPGPYDKEEWSAIHAQVLALQEQRQRRGNSAGENARALTAFRRRASTSPVLR